VKRIHICDFDTVSPSNICRTAYGERDIGRLKVDALRDILHTIRSDIEVDVCAQNLSDADDDVLVEWIERSDLVIAATDHPPTQSRLGALSYHRVPAIFCGVYEKGIGGEVFFTLPNETACYECALGAARGGNGPSRGTQEYGIAREGLAAEPALGIDIAHVTVCAAKIALALLLRGSGAPAVDVVDGQRNILFVGNVAEYIWHRPFETVWGRVPRRTRCICQLEVGASTADLLDDPYAAGA
jgi:hypothetical protein